MKRTTHDQIIASSKLITDAQKKTALALIYADDGAFETGAKFLREVAESFEAECQRRAALISADDCRRRAALREPQQKRRKK